jgi:hypothetical protein
MSDDAFERDLVEWAALEILSSGGHLDVESESGDGLSLIANLSNSTWGRCTRNGGSSSPASASVGASRGQA